MSSYANRGVSAQKEEVHAAIRYMDQGMYGKSFCKIYPDFLGGDTSWVNIMHADGTGTKSILAYLYWRETGDISVWRGIAQDAIVMNLDDLLCVGAYNNIVFNSTIDRNKHRIPGEILTEIIQGSQEFFDTLKKYDVHVHYLGGETADVGDLVRTVAVNGVMSVRWPKNKLITNEKITAGDVIVGLASYGQANYEQYYNSGIGSNGLTGARHDVLSKYYAEKYPETYEKSLDENILYIGNYKMTDKIAEGADHHFIGKLLLSPTRTYVPIVKEMLEQHFDKIHGLVHCSGGGQTKCLHYVPDNVKIIKDNLFDPPYIFKLIQQCGNSDAREMYQVYNMGCRLEIYCSRADAPLMIAIANSFGVDAQVIGKVESAEKKSLEIQMKEEIITYI